MGKFEVAIGGGFWVAAEDTYRIVVSDLVRRHWDGITAYYDP